MRTIVYRVDATAVPADLFLHTAMNEVDSLTLDYASSDGGLIGYDDHGPIAPGQRPKRCEHSRQERELVPSLDILRSIGIDDAISIEEDGAAGFWMGHCGRPILVTLAIAVRCRDLAYLKSLVSAVASVIPV